MPAGTPVVLSSFNCAPIPVAPPPGEQRRPRPDGSPVVEPAAAVGLFALRDRHADDDQTMAAREPHLLARLDRRQCEVGRQRWRGPCSDIDPGTITFVLNFIITGGRY